MFRIVSRLFRCFLRTALLASLTLFGPRGGFLSSAEPALDGFGIARGTAGVLALLAVNSTYGSRLGGITGLPLTPPSLTDPLDVLSAPAVMLVLSVAAVCFTRRGFRRHAARSLVYPVQASVLFLALMIGSRWVLPLASYAGSGATVLLEPLAAAAAVWYLAFLVCAAWCCAAGPFRAADGHPLLAPAAAVVFSWLAAARVHSADALAGGMPPVLYLAVVLGGPVTVTALSAFEVWQLRSRYPEFPFREGPLPGSRAEAPWSGAPLKVFCHDELAKFREQVKDARHLLWLAFKNFPSKSPAH